MLEKLIEKVDGLWDETETAKKRNMVKAKNERILSCRNKLDKATISDERRFNSSAKLKLEQLVEENRLKRRCAGSGAKRKLDSEAEEFIVNCIEGKGEAHPRRHDSIIQVKRMKYDDLVEHTNKHLASRGKPLIKSKSTLQLLSKPKNVRSRQAQFHHGKGLFCSKKPSKTSCENNINTHHQRAQVKLLRKDMFTDPVKAKSSLAISMDDKATLKPGTDVGVKGVRKQQILTSTESKDGAFPQHDFSNSKLHITPSSFRFMTKKIDDATEQLIRDDDQSVVVVRPKYFTGSSGGIWGSDYIRISHEYPNLYEKGGESDFSMPVKRLCSAISDHCSYFIDTLEREDVERVKKNLPQNKFNQYEMKRLKSLQNGLTKSMELFIATTTTVPEGEQDSISPLLDDVKSLTQLVSSVLEQMSSLSGTSLWISYKPINKYCESVVSFCDNHLPAKKEIVAELTDAGPGVGVSNHEVRYRMAEITRLHKTHRRTRVHRATGDSAQNESERTNACIGEALVDGGPLHWNYFDVQECYGREELDAMTKEELESKEEECTQKNAWNVCRNVSERIHMEPGPAGDLMFSMVEEEQLFFYNSQELSTFLKTAKSQRYGLPGYHYFSKIETFIDEHSERGELFLEYRLGACTKDGDYAMCQFCKDKIANVVAKSPRPYPDHQMLDRYKYLELQDTPLDERETDDFAPRVNLKCCFNTGNISSTDERAVEQFCTKYIVDQTYVLSYLKHLEMLELKRQKRQAEKKRKRPAEDVVEENRNETDINSDSDDSDSDEEVVIAVVSEDISEDVSVDVSVVGEAVTRCGRRCTTYKERRFFGDSD